MTEIGTHSGMPAAGPQRRAYAAGGALYVLMAGLLLLLVRRSGWGHGQIYMGLLIANGVLCAVCVLIRNPVLLVRRMRIGLDTKKWDLFWLATFVAIVAIVVVVAIKDLDSRHAGPVQPGLAWLTGMSIFVGGWCLITWSMITNPFFENTVRIQVGQGHRVIDGGPYAHVRHPGYVGFSALLIATPLLLDSPWTFVPSATGVLWLVIRTLLEDRTLDAELPNYRAYAARVRFRLIPGIW